VLVVARRVPRLALIRDALARLPRGAAKWRLIEQAGPMERAGGVYVQRAGLSLREAEDLLAATTLHGNIPEPLRLAHLIAGGITTGKSRGRAGGPPHRTRGGGRRPGRSTRSPTSC